MYAAIEIGPVASIALAIVLASGVDHCRSGIAGAVTSF